MSLLVLALLLLTAGIGFPASAADPGDERLGSFNGTLKHPTLDSTLAALARDAEQGRGSIGRFSPDGLQMDGETVAVSVRTSIAPDAVAAWLRAHGVRVANIGSRTIEAYLPVDELAELGSATGVASVSTLKRPVAHVVSQGVGLHGSLGWNAGGFGGAGVKVGVIDVGFDGFDLLIGTELTQPHMRCYRLVGDPGTNISDCDRITEHGTAVSETLLDVAPQAELYIANPQSNLDLHNTVEWMMSEGVSVINHSVGWTWEGPGDGTSVYDDGILAAVQKAVAAGITWVNSSGNEGESTWSGGFTDVDDDGTMEFAEDGGVERNAVQGFAGFELTFQLRWDDSWRNATNDLDLYLVDSAGEVIRESADGQNGRPGDAPFEYLSFIPPVNKTYFLEVRQFGGGTPNWVQLQEFNGYALEYASAAGSVGNPAESGVPGVLAVGAANWKTPSTIERFSSRGPTRDNRIKPDLVGFDFADTVTYGPSGFSGTSQASPHIAGLAALVKQRFADYSPAQIAEYLKANADRAASPDNVWGWGFASLPDVDATMNPVPEITRIDPSTLTSGSLSVDITVDGSGFTEESIARLNGQGRPTTFISATELTVAAVILDIETPGQIAITVFNPGPGGGSSNAVMLTVGESLAIVTDAFERTWQRTDKPVNDLIRSRTWMWGQSPFTGFVTEDYIEGPNGERTVVYYDKSRMEITDPNYDQTSIWYVTNGLLVQELITGERQMGDGEFDEFSPSTVNIAGDLDGETGPTYAALGNLLNTAPAEDNTIIRQRVDADGTVTIDEALADYAVTADEHVVQDDIDHQVASVFWTFMTSTDTIYEDGQFIDDRLFENPFYATGFPITEAYWTTVPVAGIAQDVLVQCFERRCLTWTPENDPGWEVEAGNVGQHYYIWRYGTMP